MKKAKKLKYLLMQINDKLILLFAEFWEKILNGVYMNSIPRVESKRIIVPFEQL